MFKKYEKYLGVANGVDEGMTPRVLDIGLSATA
jgi:hypothetical protein